MIQTLNIFILLNPTYIINTLYQTIFYCDRSIGPTPRYHKWAFIWRFIFLRSVIIEHELISNFIVVFNLFLFCGYFLYWFASASADMLINNPPYVLLGESYHGQIIIGLDYNLLTYFFLSKCSNSDAAKIPDHRSYLST